MPLKQLTSHNNVRRAFCSLFAAILPSSSSATHHFDCLFLFLLFSASFSLSVSFSLSLPPEHLFVCISNILNERALFYSTGRDCLQARRMPALCVCVFACAPDTAVHGKGVMNSSVEQRHTTACRSIFNKNSAVHKQRKNCVRACVFGKSSAVGLRGNKHIVISGF